MEIETKNNKELFIEIMEVLKTQRKKDVSYNEKIEELYDIEFYDGYDHSLLFKQLIKILHIISDTPLDKDSDILYFIDELNFGEDYRDGSIIQKDGSLIDFSSSEKLYEYLTKQ